MILSWTIIFGVMSPKHRQQKIKSTTCVKLKSFGTAKRVETGEGGLLASHKSDREEESTKRPGTVVHVCTPSTREAKTGGSL